MWKSFAAQKEQVGSNLQGLKEATVKNAGIVGEYTKNAATNIIDNYGKEEPDKNSPNKETNQDPTNIAKQPLKKKKPLKKTVIES